MTFYNPEMEQKAFEWLLLVYREKYKHWIVSLCRSVYFQFLSTYFTPPCKKINPWGIVTSQSEMRGFVVETWSNLACSLSILLPK